MQASDISKAKQLSAQLAKLGYARTPSAKKPTKKAIKTPFTFPYKAITENTAVFTQIETLQKELKALKMVVPQTTILEKEPIPFELTSEMVKEIVKMMHKLPENERLDVSGIRNFQSFVFKGTKYGVEEMMHGGGAGSSSSGFQQPILGVVDGVNTIFTWTTAPSVLVVDNGRAIQKTSSDGTQNWTGTTTTTLLIAPTFDLYAIS